MKPLLSLVCTQIARNKLLILTAFSVSTTYQSQAVTAFSALKRIRPLTMFWIPDCDVHTFTL